LRFYAEEVVAKVEQLLKVSTLLEILQEEEKEEEEDEEWNMFQPFLRFYYIAPQRSLRRIHANVSTLLEILPRMLYV